VLFIEALRKKIRWDKHPETKVIYLGFSQGVTTLLRWLNDIAPRADYLLMWAGGLPDDLLFAHRQEYFRQINSHYFVGDRDPYFTPALVMDKKHLMDDMGIEFMLHEYPGTHKVDEATLKNWVAEHLTRPL
ncbi:MAG TPA: hypothetical protein VLA46_08590, partial [Saprospiraceae bacterium]|nr:hypothetical protein [Saprospiraceae bacterium]